MSKFMNSFANLGLNSKLIDVLHDIGYKQPLPIQIRCIPYLLKGCDVLGMAQTGSGKTAAFVLPLLQNVDIKRSFSQGLIIAPTRELTIQIAQVCKDFIKYMRSINIISLYGGQNYNVQFQDLKKNPHIIVGTPGRLLDHLKRGTLDLSNLKTLIIDEADEMLRMGFIEEIERILTYIPVKHQTALFSATFPMNIRKIIHRFTQNPKEIYLNIGVGNVCTEIKQNYCLIRGIQKYEVLMRFLEIEEFDAAIVFVRTKCATLKISEILKKFGYNSEALNGDMNQTVRCKTLSRLRCGDLNILIATDVAARGLDINRVNLVINYDIPTNFNDYVHRIGRTGRAGNVGKSLLFIENREYRLFFNIRRKIKLNIIEVRCPTSEVLVKFRLVKFIDKVSNQLRTATDLDKYYSLLEIIKYEQNLTIERLSAILLKMAQGSRPLVLPSDSMIKNKKSIHRKVCVKKKYIR